MKIRIFAKDDDEDVHDIEIWDVKDYVNILIEYGILDSEGERYTVSDVVYDAYQNAIDIICESQKR